MRCGLILEAALAAGADDVLWDDDEEDEHDGAAQDAARVVCAPAAFPHVLQAFTALAKGPDPKPTIVNAAIIRNPLNAVELQGEQLEAFQAMLAEFEDSPDVQNVFHNVQ